MTATIIELDRGTPGPVTPTLDRAWENMKQLMFDAGIESFILARADYDSDGGAWPFEVEWSFEGETRKAFVWMLGLPLHHLKVPQRSVTYFVPRLVVDGNTWLWPYAVETLRGES